MDAFMPVTNGAEATEQIIQIAPHMKILMMSAFPMAQSNHVIAQGLIAGAQDFCGTPILEFSPGVAVSDSMLKIAGQSLYIKIDTLI
jgi:CheY-like chemotaxis protein